jgi:glycosidase
MPALNPTLNMQAETMSSAGWLRQATIYGIVVRNIGNGDFQSVIDRLDDLADLGIAALWFAPITPTPPGCFGYEVTDYREVRSEYGTLDDFRRLVEAAHARNIRVLLDFVPNHTSAEHPSYQSVLQDGESSPWYDFYDRDEHGNVTNYFDWTHLPNLNFDNPDVRRFVTDAFMFWVREMDVDGFRVDVAWGIKQRRPDFWPEFSAEFKRAKPDGVLIAEASARDPYYVENGFDAAYDWTDRLGEWAWTGVFTDESSIPGAIAQALTHPDGRPNPNCLRFLNNNDTGVRFITTHGVDLYRVASAMLLTLPGVPCLFTGDEIGAEFEPYRESGPIAWSDTHDLRTHFRKLIRLRNELPSLSDGKWAKIETGPAESILGYAMDEGEAAVLVLLNFSEQAATVTINPESFDSLFPDATTLLDLYADATFDITRDSGDGIPMPAWGIRILTAGSLT